MIDSVEWRMSDDYAEHLQRQRIAEVKEASRQLVTELYGDKCPDHDHLCSVCLAWEAWEKLFSILEV